MNDHDRTIANLIQPQSDKIRQLAGELYGHSSVSAYRITILRLKAELGILEILLPMLEKEENR
jgi:hypothetical protein